MANGTPIKASLYLETWKAMKASFSIWWPWVLGFGAVFAITQFVFGQPMPKIDPDLMAQIQKNPDLLKHPSPEFLQQHPQFATSNPFGPFIGSLVNMVLQAVALYVFTVAYLRFAMVKSQPTYSVGGFFHWLGQIIWKFLRPILWNLILVIGTFIYIRSILRYAAVGPLAILRRGPELQKSWELTEGHAWRIFWNQLCLSFLLGFPMALVSAIPILLLIFLAHGDTTALGVRGGIALIMGLFTAIFSMAISIFYCTVYRVLIQERRPAAAPPMNPAKP